MSDKKTLEQIRDNGSKRHCWPREQISDVYQYGYIAGFDASTAIHQERTRKLVEALGLAETAMSHALALGYVGEGSTNGMFKQSIKEANDALQEWEDYEKKEI